MTKTTTKLEGMCALLPGGEVLQIHSLVGVFYLTDLRATSGKGAGNIKSRYQNIAEAFRPIMGKLESRLVDHRRSEDRGLRELNFLLRKVGSKGPFGQR